MNLKKKLIKNKNKMKRKEKLNENLIQKKKTRRR